MKVSILEVRSVTGDDQDGRVQVRSYTHHGHEQTQVKDHELPISSFVMPITSASTNRIGTSPTGMIPGSRVLAFFMDEAEQYPVILGTFPRTGDLTDPSDVTGGHDTIRTKNSDVHSSAHDEGIQGLDGGSTTVGFLVDGDKTKLSDTANGQFQSWRLNQDKRYVFEKIQAFNEMPHVPRDNAVEHTEAADKEHIKQTKDLKTVVKVTKQESLEQYGDPPDIMKMVQNVDPEFKSEVLPRSVTNFQPIVSGSSDGATSSTKPAATSQGATNALTGLSQSMGFSTVISGLGSALGVK